MGTTLGRGRYERLFLTRRMFQETSPLPQHIGVVYRGIYFVIPVITISVVLNRFIFVKKEYIPIPFSNHKKLVIGIGKDLLERLELFGGR